MKAIKAEGLTKRYKNLVAVDGLNLEIEQGELFSRAVDTEQGK